MDENTKRWLPDLAVENETSSFVTLNRLDQMENFNLNFKKFFDFVGISIDADLQFLENDTKKRNFFSKILVDNFSFKEQEANSFLQVLLETYRGISADIDPFAFYLSRHGFSRYLDPFKSLGISAEEVSDFFERNDDYFIFTNLKKAAKSTVVSANDVSSLRRKIKSSPIFALTDKNRRLTADPIHTFIDLPKWMWENVVDTPHFQRLRNLTQIGNAKFVYSSGEHTRFSHSLGVGFLAGTLLSQVVSKGNFEEENVSQIQQMVQIAGLCHDLGHGPMSHVFETAFEEPADGYPGFCHEEMSVKLLEDLWSDKLINILGSHSRKEVSEMVLGTDCIYVDGFYSEEIKNAAMHIVHNKKTGVDVDKFDYLARDPYYCGPALAHARFNPTRLMRFSAVLQGEICFNAKERSQVEKLFESRKIMWENVYAHPKVLAFDRMTAKVLGLVDHIFKFRAKSQEVDTFLDLDDTSIDEVKKYLRNYRPTSDDKLNEAQSLMKRIVNRDTWILVDDYRCIAPLPSSFSENSIKDELIKLARANHGRLRATDFHVVVTKISSQGVKNVMAYEPYDETTKTLMFRNCNDLSHYSWSPETLVRFFATDSSVFDEIDMASQLWEVQNSEIVIYKIPGTRRDIPTRSRIIQDPSPSKRQKTPLSQGSSPRYSQ
eukprot:GHVP01031299.1.p1 GENE.GHVP01031299.1~~GHVP01031299.1.p1  ORF type:complete len:670 (+),score=107.67 GHVP01031299.1:31-2010(+)